MGSPLVRWLAGRSPDELAAILAHRPDVLVAPPLADLGALAGRLQMNGSVLAAFATVPLPAIQVVDAMAGCGGPAVTEERLAATLGRTPGDPDLVAALTVLAERALVWADPEGTLRMAGALWSACAGPSRGADWRARFDPEPPPLVLGDASNEMVARETAAAGTLAVERVGALLDAAPVALLKSGGVGARELRRLGADARLWLELAYGAGLLGYADGALTPTPAYDDWRAASPGGRLVPLLRAWRSLPVAPLATHRPDGEPAGAALTADPAWSAVVELRAALARLLDEVPPGRGASDGSLAELLRWRLPVLVPEASLVDWLLTEARLVGAIAHGASTPLGRAVFAADPGALAAVAEDLLPAAVGEAVFQTDLTALVPGVPTGPLADLLDAAADRESRAGASTWRFGPASVRAAFDAGYTADSLRDGLRAVAVGGALPQALEYLVADVGRRHGRVRVRAVASVLHAEEPAMLRELVRAKALRDLRLTVLAPTVLASAKPADVTLAALRAAGYAPVGEDATGAPTIVRRAEPRGVPRRRPGHVPAARNAPEATEVGAIAKRLLAHGSARSARLEVPADLPRRLEIAAVRGEGPTVRTAEASYPPMLWLVPDLPEEPDEPRRVAEVVRRHAGSLPGPQQEMLTRAIVAGGPVRIDYRDSGGDFSTRVIEPLELDQVLLTAWCQLRDAERMFSLDRIESVSPA